MSSNISTNDSTAVAGSTEIAANIVGYTIIFIISLIGNLIISIITVQKKTGRTPIDILIFALAICDLVITVSIPFVAVSTIEPFFPFGIAGCKILFGLRNTAIYSSAFILLIISLERYYATFDLSRSRRDLRITIAFISIAAIIAFGLTIPQFNILQLVTNQNVGVSCLEVWAEDSSVGRKVYSMMLIIMTFAIPFIIITISNIAIWYKLFHARRKSTANQMRLKAKRQVVAIMIAVSAVFFICLLPIYLINTLADFEAITYTPPVLVVTYVFTWIAYSHSMWNPIIYIIGSSNMRKSCKTLLRLNQCDSSTHFKNKRNSNSKQSLKLIGKVMSNNKIAPSTNATPANELVSIK